MTDPRELPEWAQLDAEDGHEPGGVLICRLALFTAGILLGIGIMEFVT